jgi:hypothetical protein
MWNMLKNEAEKKAPRFKHYNHWYKYIVYNERFIEKDCNIEICG